MNFLRKIQNLSDSRKKIILWSIVIIIGLGFITLYIKNIQKRLASFKIGELKEELNLPKIEMPKLEMPKMEMPEMSQEELKKLEEIMEEEAEKYGQ